MVQRESNGFSGDQGLGGDGRSFLLLMLYLLRYLCNLFYY